MLDSFSDAWLVCLFIFRRFQATKYPWFLSPSPHSISNSKIPTELPIMLNKLSPPSSHFRVSSELQINYLLDMSSWASNSTCSHHAGPLPIISYIHEWHHHALICSNLEINPASASSLFHNQTLTKILSPKNVVNSSISICIIPSPKSRPLSSRYWKSPQTISFPKARVIF